MIVDLHFLFYNTSMYSLKIICYRLTTSIDIKTRIIQYQDYYSKKFFHILLSAIPEHFPEKFML